jgi:hypothetical protein
VELEGPRHLEIVAGTTPHERHAGAEHAVGAADDLLLVAGEAVAQQQEHFVREVVPRGQALRDTRSRRTEVARSLGGNGRLDRKAVAAHGGDDDARIAGPGGRDLAGGRTSDQRHIARPAANLAQHGGEVVCR